jgi:hypothetical protein
MFFPQPSAVVQDGGMACEPLMSVSLPQAGNVKRPESP